MTAAPSPLIAAETLLRRIDDPALRLFDCRFSLAQPELGQRAYADGHLPGAIYAHLDEHLSGPITAASGRHPLPDPARLAHWLGSCGVDHASTVVAYDDMGGAFAVRLWWLLSQWLGLGERSSERSGAGQKEGVGQVAVLDGGLQGWIAAGGELSTEVPVFEPGAFEPRHNDDRWLDTATLQSMLASNRIQIIDARARERFNGEVEPIDPVAGHIPGAINLPLSENLDGFGRFLRPDQLRERFQAAIGARPPTEIAHSCGSGVNACHNLLAMELAGLHGSRLYAGSWSEWIRDPTRPIATGADCLTAITQGRRDSALAETAGLTYDQAAELLLIERPRPAGGDG